MRLATRRHVCRPRTSPARRPCQYDIGGLPPDPRQGDELLPIRGNNAAKFIDQLLREQDDVLRLGSEEADGAICSRTASSPSASIFSGVSCLREKCPGRLVHARIRRLRRQHDRDEQGEGVDMFKLPLRSGSRDWKSAKIASTTASVTGFGAFGAAGLRRFRGLVMSIISL